VPQHPIRSERKIILAKVMIVDDDRTMTSLMQTLLELDGYDVVIVSRGADVIAKAEQTRPDIIVMDYHLADTHGVEIVKDIRAHSTLSHTPIVIASGMDVSDEVLAAGANEFLTKPFDPDDLPIIFKRLNVN
jgi:DNA-binding response OmpR family regulator